MQLRTGPVGDKKIQEVRGHAIDMLLRDLDATARSRPPECAKLRQSSTACLLDARNARVRAIRGLLTVTGVSMLAVCE